MGVDVSESKPSIWRRWFGAPPPLAKEQPVPVSQAYTAATRARLEERAAVQRQSALDDERSRLVVEASIKRQYAADIMTAIAHIEALEREREAAREPDSKGRVQSLESGLDGRERDEGGEGVCKVVGVFGQKSVAAEPGHARSNGRGSMAKPFLSSLS